MYWLVVFIILFVSGARYKVGTDYETYMLNYDYLYTKDAVSIIDQPSLYIIAKATELIEHNSALWFIAMSIITIVPVAFVIKKYSEDAMFSFLMFVLIGSWHFSFNMVKQSAAMAILFAGFSHLLNRNFIGWTFHCLLACTFHVSALFMIPVYFFADIKFSRRNIYICTIIAIVLSFSYEWLFSLINMVKQRGHISQNSKDLTNDVNILRIFVNCVPVIFVWLSRKFHDFKNPKFCLCLNLSVLNMLLNLVSMHSVYMNRIAVYTNVFNVLLFPYFVKNFKKQWKVVFLSSMVSLYTVFWIYDLYKSQYTRTFNWIF